MPTPGASRCVFPGARHGVRAKPGNICDRLAMHCFVTTLPVFDSLEVSLTTTLIVPTKHLGRRDGIWVRIVQNMQRSAFVSPVGQYVMGHASSDRSDQEN